MTDYHQTAIDYLLGELSPEDMKFFDQLVEKNPEARSAFNAATEDLSFLGQTAQTATPNLDLKSRVLDLCPPRDTFGEPVLAGQLAETIADAPVDLSHRYDGGGAQVELNDLQSTEHRDFLLRTYETHLELWPHVSGTSPAAAGDLRELRETLSSLAPTFPQIHELSSTDKIARASHELPCRSLQVSYLATLPALGYFCNKVQTDQADVSDARRLYYLCRDQLKIMRSVFRDIDPSRLVDDKKYRIHGTDMLRRKWRGAQHAWFKDTGKISIGNCFDGPINTSRLEFAEYIANVYCLANLLASKSTDGLYKIELYEGLIKDASITVVSANTSADQHSKLMQLVAEKPLLAPFEQSEEHYLVNLVAASVSRAVNLDGDRDSILSKQMGCLAEGQESKIYFTWPELR